MSHTDLIRSIRAAAESDPEACFDNVSDMLRWLNDDAEEVSNRLLGAYINDRGEAV